MDFRVGEAIHIVRVKDKPDYVECEGVIEAIDDLGQLQGTWGEQVINPQEDTISKLGLTEKGPAESYPWMTKGEKIAWEYLNKWFADHVTVPYMFMVASGRAYSMANPDECIALEALFGVHHGYVEVVAGMPPICIIDFLTTDGVRYRLFLRATELSAELLNHISDSDLEWLMEAYEVEKYEIDNLIADKEEQ